ncbi:MAG TPA: cytochrome c oxidase subunit II [Alphaproteobacteria bacterium]|nr:cytochrome c oxidase subunit II [Alphaproteobacteria bacterium]
MSSITRFCCSARLALGAALAVFLSTGSALAETAYNWQMGFQPAASPVMENITSFHHILLILITGITLFVLSLLLYVMLRFNSRANPVPSTNTHNTPLEIIWTVVPIIILVVMAIPSFRLLYLEDVVPESEMTLKLTGNQWFWNVEYPDHDSLTYDITMLEDADRPADAPRLLAVDNEIVVPVDTTIRVQTTASDVIHAFAIPVMGVKIDAIPGQLNETWFKATREGTFYGQCSELCGSRHAFMPTALKVVSKEAFAAWLEEAKVKHASSPVQQPVGLASAATVR